MPAIKAVLFDLDDTLWPIVPVIVRAERLLFDWIREHAPAVASSYSIEEMRARRVALLKSEPRYTVNLAALRHAVLSEVFAACGENTGAVDTAMEIFTDARNQVEPYPDVHPVLASLSRRVVLGSVSNGVADLGAIGMAHYFSISVAAHQFGSAKPDPAIFHAACDALQVAPAEAVYVGDDPLLDVEGAQRAGLRGVWLRRQDLLPARSMPQHVQPDAVCGSLHELEEWLAGHIMVAPEALRS
ncbi:MAG: HAD family hydrolase [Noviherbaspirillum sp.]